MQTRVAVMAIIVDKADSVEKLNAVLHEFGDTLSGEWGCRTGRGMLISFPLQLMRRRMLFRHLQAGSAILSE